MRKPTTLVLSTLVVGAMLVPATAGADHDRGPSFSIGSHFRVGGLDIALVFRDRGPRYAPYPYYRFPRRIAYRGYDCTDRCFVRGGHSYHARSCPVAAHYFRSHRFDPGPFWVRSAPRVHHRPHRPPVRYSVPPGHRKHGRHWVPPGHRKHGRHWVPPGHRKHREHGHYQHDRRRGHRHGPSCDHRDHRGRRGHRGHWEWDDGRWEWDDD